MEYLRSTTPVVERSESPGVSHAKRTCTLKALSDNRGVAETCPICNYALPVPAPIIWRIFGRVYHGLNVYEKAIAAYEPALELTRKLEQEFNVLSLLNNLGMVYHSSGDYDKALTAYNELLERIDPEDEANFAILLSNLGMVHPELPSC